MPNKEQLELLERGADTWNEWRHQHPAVRLTDLEGANLRSVDLEGANLRGANLTGANFMDGNLNRADLCGANLTGATLNNTTLVNATLDDAHLIDATLNRADLANASLTSAHLCDADLSGANLNGANLSGANIVNANLARAELTEANLIDTKLNGANLKGANLVGVDLASAEVHASLSGADLTRANLAGADLAHANLSRARLVEADLTGTLLGHSILTGANLTGARLTNADLAHASLTEADLQKTKLRGVSFEGANLSGLTVDLASLSEIPIKQQKKWGHTWNIRLDEGGLTQLASAQRHHIRRSIEFPPEYHEAGTAILAYFATILREKYPETPVGVSIIQEGYNVTLVIENSEGMREEIEETLENFGLVVTGEKPVEEFLENPVHALELKGELRLMQARLENKNELLALKDQIIENQRIDIRELRALIGILAQRPMRAPATINVPVGINVNTEPTFHLSAYLEPLQAHLAELAKVVPEKDRPQELTKAEADLESLRGETDPEEVKPRLSRVRKVLEALTDENSGFSKAVKGTKKGLEAVQHIARTYNSLAEWCGLPLVPKPLLGQDD